MGIANPAWRCKRLVKRHFFFFALSTFYDDAREESNNDGIVDSLLFVKRRPNDSTVSQTSMSQQYLHLFVHEPR